MDSSLALALHGLVAAQPVVSSLVVGVASFGIFVLPVVMVAIWFALDSGRLDGRGALVSGCVAAVIAICLGLILERTLGRPRPFVALGFEPLIPHAADSSFPSDHTLVGVALVGGLTLRRPFVGVWLLLWALLVGAARVAAGLHYPSDIVGSALLALLLDALVLRIIRSLVGRLPLRIRRSIALDP